jgi:hypothetical protein
VPSSLRLATVEFILASHAGRELRLRDHVRALADYFDFILIDTPPSLGLLTINALVAADWVLIPTEARDFAVRGVQNVQDTIEELYRARRMNPKLGGFGIMLSKYDRRLREERAVAAFLRACWGDLVLTTEIGVNSKILEASSAGTYPLFHHDQKPTLRYLKLAREIMDRTRQCPAPGVIPEAVPTIDPRVHVDQRGAASGVPTWMGVPGEPASSIPMQEGAHQPLAHPLAAKGASVLLSDYPTSEPLMPEAPLANRVLNKTVWRTEVLGDRDLGPRSVQADGAAHEGPFSERGADAGSPEHARGNPTSAREGEVDGTTLSPAMATAVSVLTRAFPGLAGRLPLAQLMRLGAPLVAGICAVCLLVVGAGVLRAASNSPSGLQGTEPQLTQPLEDAGFAHDSQSETRGPLGLLQQILDSATRPLRPQDRTVETPTRAGLAYRAAFGHSLDKDLPEHEAEVEAWLATWEAAYRAGEPWARALLRDAPGGP